MSVKYPGTVMDIFIVANRVTHFYHDEFICFLFSSDNYLYPFESFAPWLQLLLRRLLSHENGKMRRVVLMSFLNHDFGSVMHRDLNNTVSQSAPSSLNLSCSFVTGPLLTTLCQGSFYGGARGPSTGAAVANVCTPLFSCLLWI